MLLKSLRHGIVTRISSAIQIGASDISTGKKGSCCRIHQQTNFSIWHDDFIMFCPCVPERWSLDTTTPQAIVNGITGVKYRQVSQVTFIIIQKHLQTIHIWYQQRIAEPTFMLYVRKFHVLRISGLSVSIWLTSFGTKRCPRYTGRIQQNWAAPRKAQDIKAFLAFFFLCVWKNAWCERILAEWSKWFAERPRTVWICYSNPTISPNLGTLKIHQLAIRQMDAPGITARKIRGIRSPCCP